MNVLNYLNSLEVSTAEQALEHLTAEYGVKVSVNEKYPDLFCLNYDQIESPKREPIVIECRSLVLKLVDGKFDVASRSFDRFFNYGETDEEYDIKDLVAYEKIDGSLVTLFVHNGEILYRTRSMIMPDDSLKINGGNLSWKELIESTIIDSIGYVDGQCSYIFEVVSPENRVVTRYADRKAFLLAIRENKTGVYLPLASNGLCRVPRKYQFDTIEHCLQSSRELRNLEEGFVMYLDGTPVMKIKNPAYVAAHHLRGEGALSNKRIMDLIIINETDEYLSIFPEDAERFQPFIDAYNTGLKTSAHVYDTYAHIEDQKEFALKVKDYPYASMIFNMRKHENKNVLHHFERMTQNSKYAFIEGFLNA